MGAWGEGPISNDTAADFCGYALEECAEKVRKVLNADKVDRDEVRAAAFILARIGFNYVWPGEIEEDITTALKWLKQFKEDEEWVGQWKDREALIASLEKQIAELEFTLTEGSGEVGLLEKMMTAITIGGDYAPSG